MNRQLTDDEREFLKGCDVFKPYSSIDEYIADIRRCLTLSSWHYTDDQAKTLMANPTRKVWIQEAFANREPAGDIAADVGYCCG